jgi:hypothetical protein
LPISSAGIGQPNWKTSRQNELIDRNFEDVLEAYDISEINCAGEPIASTKNP